MTFIIAEVGSNWNSFEDCSNSIVMAKNVGADACKFQLFNGEDLYGQPAEVKGQLPDGWVSQLKIKADACGIEFMVTAFSERGLDIIDPYVKRHKIPSSLANHPPFIEAVKAKGKPIIASTGGLSWPEICSLVEMLYGSSYALLYCVSSYPSEDVDLESIEFMMANLKGNPNVGYSCHMADYTAALAAVRKYGATILEKHFKLRDDMNTPDSPHSLTPERFKEMVKRIRGEYGTIFPARSEDAFCITAKSRCVATCDINSGEELVYGTNYGFFRTLKPDALALTPYVPVNGRKAARDIKCGNGIGIMDLV